MQIRANLKLKIDLNTKQLLAKILIRTVKPIAKLVIYLRLYRDFREGVV